MKRQTFMKSTLCLLMALVCNVAWAAIEVSTSVGTPEHVYRIKSKNNFWMTSCTSLGAEANSGVFAFFNAGGDGAYKVYSVERQKWVSYFKAKEYKNGTCAAILVDTQEEANAWKVTASGDYYLFAPYLSNGNVAGFYWNWFEGIGSNPSNNVTLTIGLYNSNSDGGSLWTLSEVEEFDFTKIVDLNGTYTDQAGQSYSCTYKGIQGKTKPVAFGGGVAAISAEAWNGNSYTANISFPFMPSNAEVTNHVVISPYSDFRYKYFASGTDVKSNNKMNTSLPTDVKNYLWAFYSASYTDGGFKFKIKNVGTGTYLYSDPTTENHADNDVLLKENIDEASSFIIIAGNQIINEGGKYLSVSSSGDGTKNVGNYHMNHNGTKNKFVAANNYTLTLSDESTYSGTNGVHNVQGGSYTYTDGVWSENGYSAKVDFNFTSLPFPLSSAEKVNPTMISSFNEGAGGYGPGRFKWYAAKDDDGDDDVKIKRDALVTEDLIEAYSWAIYPSIENGAFVYSIKNVALDKYIQATKNFGQNAGDNNEGTIILSDTPTKFSVDSNNSLYFFANERNQYLSLGSSSTTEGFLGIHTKTYAAGHKGITNAFLTPRYALASKDELKSGGIYTFLTARGWVGATDSDNVIATANTAVTPAASTENAMFQWALYQSKNGNYYLYNLGKKKFMGDVDQSVNEGNIPFANSPMNKNMTFKNNAQAANFPIMFSTNNTHAVSQNTAKGLFAWKGGWNNNDEGSNHQVSYIGELDAEQLKTIADLVEAYDKSMPMKVEVEGSWENNPNTHFGNLTVTTGSAVATTKLTLENMEISYVEYAGAGDILDFTRAYRGFEFQGFHVGEQSLGKSFELTEEQEANITEQNPLIAKFTATEAVTLFYDDDEFSYRIPAIERTSTDRLIAVSDYRHSLDDIGRYNHGAANPGIDLVIRTSDNNGQTWSETKTIAAGTGVRGANDCAYGDAAIAVVGQKVLVMAAAGDVFFPHANASNNNRVVRIWNENNGDGDWDKEDISTELFLGGNALFPNGYAAFFGSGRMPVDETGRIYGAMLLRNAAAGNNIYVVYSDDLGDTWKILGGSQTQVARADEPKVEILPNGQILLSARRGGGRHFRVFTYGTGETDWANGVGTWSNTKNGCDNGGKNGTNGEIYHLEALNANGQRVNILLQSQPKGGNDEFDRKDVTIWYKEITETNGSYTIDMIADNWREGLQVSYQKSAYSAMTLQEDGRMAFFFEEAPCFGDDHTKGYSMVYMPLTIEQITKSNYFSLDADLTAEHVINVVLTDAQGNEYRQQVTSTLGGVATKLSDDYPFITLGDNATLESADGESFTYTNTVTLPFKVSNENTTVWHNIYYPINTNEHNYPVYMSAIENEGVVKISYENAVYGNSSFNTQANSASISWAFYQEGTGLTFKLKNKLNGKYVKTTSGATNSNGGANVQYTENIAEAAAFVPSKEGHNSNYLGEYSLKVGDGFICVWTVSDGRVTYTTNKGHKGAWVKFVEAPNFETLFAEVNAVLNMFGDGLGQYSNITEANLAAVTAAKTAMQTPGSVKLNTLNEYKNYTSKTEGCTLNRPKDGQFFRVAYDYGGSVGKLYMQGENSSVKGVKFTADKGAASIWQYRDGGLYSYTAEKYLYEEGDNRGLIVSQKNATFNDSPRAKGKYTIACTSYVHANKSGNNYFTDHCSSNNCAEHDFILEEITVTIGNLGYSTLYSEVALNIPNGLTAYTGDYNETASTLTLTEIADVIPAATAVILKGAAGKYAFNVTSNIELTTKNDLRGTARDIETSSVTNEGEVVYTLQPNENENGVVFMQYTGKTLAANKAYLVLPENENGEAQSISIRFEGSTDIEHSTLNPQPSTQIYDLMGRRVEAMTKGGIYIVNGKKVVIK